MSSLGRMRNLKSLIIVIIIPNLSITFKKSLRSIIDTTQNPPAKRRKSFTCTNSRQSSSDPSPRMFTSDPSPSSSNLHHLSFIIHSRSPAIQSSSISHQILSLSPWLWRSASRGERQQPPRRAPQPRRSLAASVEGSRRRNAAVAVDESRRNRFAQKITPCITTSTSSERRNQRNMFNTRMLSAVMECWHNYEDIRWDWGECETRLGCLGHRRLSFKERARKKSIHKIFWRFSWF